MRKVIVAAMAAVLIPNTARGACGTHIEPLYWYKPGVGIAAVHVKKDRDENGIFGVLFVTDPPVAPPEQKPGVLLENRAEVDFIPTDPRMRTGGKDFRVGYLINIQIWKQGPRNLEFPRVDIKPSGPNGYRREYFYTACEDPYADFVVTVRAPNRRQKGQR